MGKSSLTKLKDNLKNAGVIGPKARQMDKNIQKSKKGNRSNMKDIRSRLKDVQSANVNPFELKFTRQKHQVLGRVMKGVKGKPGLTRKRGEEMVSLSFLMRLSSIIIPCLPPIPPCRPWYSLQRLVLSVVWIF